MTDFKCIKSEKDAYGDEMYCASEHGHFWIANFSNCRLKKEQMIKFLENCLDFVKECK